jgi:hypothetical protein
MNITKYSKFIVAVLGAGVTTALDLITPDTDLWMVLKIVSSMLTAIAVFIVPNTEASVDKPKWTEEDRLAWIAENGGALVQVAKDEKLAEALDRAFGPAVKPKAPADFSDIQLANDDGPRHSL